MALILPVLLALAFSHISQCALSSSSRSHFIQEILLENLNRFHSNRPALPAPDITATKQLKNLPVALALEAFCYLDFRSLTDFALTSKDSEELVNVHIKCRLMRFNPHYIFQDDFVNKVVFKITSDSLLICFELNCDNAEVVDRLELATLKYLIGAQMEMARLSILAFIHETLYGIDAHIPSDTKNWRLDFIRKCQNRRCPLTLAHYQTHHDHDLNGDLDDWTFAFDFFTRNPSIPEQIAFRASQQQHSNFHYLGASFPILSDFEIILNENLTKDSMPIGEIQTEAAFNSINWTPETINMVRAELLAIPLHIKRPRMVRLFYRKFSHLFPKYDPLLYIYTRDSLNPFQEDSIIEAGYSTQDLLWALETADLIPNLVKLDILFKLDKNKSDCYYA